MTRHLHQSAMPHEGRLGRRDPWLVRAWRAADWFDRCLALACVAMTAGVAAYILGSAAS